MDFKQWKLYPLEEDNFQEFDDEQEDDDTLSLCDLALNNNTIHVSDSEGSFQEEQSSSNYNQDLFEFFSSDFASTISTYPGDNIIFCGKMIPCKGESEIQSPINLVAKSTKKSSVFPWKYSYSLNITRSTSVKMERVKSYRTCKTFPGSTTEEEKYLETKNVSEGGRRPKSRWNLFPFGMERYRGEMELKDIKTRQSKLTDEKMRQSLKYDEMEETPIRKREQRWWSLARILGCQSSHVCNG